MKTGIARKILAELAERPGQSAEDLATALGATVRSCIASVGTLVTDSKVICTGTRRMPDRRKSCALYALTKLGRDALAKVQPMVKLPPKPSGAFPRETGAVETVEEFLAKGGRIEKLPVQWQAPTRYPRVGGLS